MPTRKNMAMRGRNSMSVQEDSHYDGSSPSGNINSSTLKKSLSFLLGFFFLLCIGPVICSSQSKPMFEASRAVLNSTAKTFSACIHPLRECPKSGKDQENHIFCMRDFKERSCPIGYDYVCGKEVNGYLVEGCFESNICLNGTANEIDFNPMTREAYLKCEKCGKDLIQSYPHDSSKMLRPGCEQNRISLSNYAQKDKMKKVFDGHPVKEDLYVCDTTQGYSDKYGNTLCHSTTVCECKKDVVCEKLLELLPNGTCDSKCAVKRNIWGNFSCAKYASEDSTSILPTSTDDLSPVNLCEIPRVPDHGQFQFPPNTTEFQVGSQITFGCADGFGPIGGNTTRTCLPNGSWDGILPKCIATRCAIPQTPFNGRIVYSENNTNNSVGTEISYACNEGYKLIGQTSRRCMSGGQWNEQPPVCVVNSCKPPVTPVNGGVVFPPDLKGFITGTEITHNCIDGFEMRGEPKQRCLGNGDWEGEVPVCIEKKSYNGIWNVLAITFASIIIITIIIVAEIILARKCRHHSTTDNSLKKVEKEADTKKLAKPSDKEQNTLKPTTHTHVVNANTCNYFIGDYNKAIHRNSPDETKSLLSMDSTVEAVEDTSNEAGKGTESKPMDDTLNDDGSTHDSGLENSILAV